MAIPTRPFLKPSLMSLLLASTLLGLALAANQVRPLRPPPTSPGNGTSVTWDKTSQDQNTCSPSTFTRASNIPFADWRDCVSLYSSWASQKGVFQIEHESGETVVPILRYRDCALGIKTLAGCHGNYSVGDVDIGAIFDGALKNCSNGSLLAARGIVECDTQSGERAALHWQIFDPNV